MAAAGHYIVPPLRGVVSQGEACMTWAAKPHQESERKQENKSMALSFRGCQKLLDEANYINESGKEAIIRGN